MSSHAFPIHEVVLVGALLAVLLVCLLLMLLSKKPDPKMTLLLGLVHDLSHDEGNESPSTGKQAEPDREELKGASGSWNNFLAAYLDARFGVPVLWEVGGSFAPD